jgi:hsp70-interacting protein
MDPEKRAFLDKAMEGLLEDETKKMKELVAALHRAEGNEEEIQAKENALDDLLDRCDRIDYALSFHSFGNGLVPTINLLKSSNDGIRLKAADLVALCVHNNPSCQKWALEAGAMELLLALHGNIDVDVDVRTKALSAISALVQHNPPGEELFLSSGGVQALKANIEGIARRLKVKTLFMLQWLLRDSAAAASRAADDGLSSVLAALALDPDEDIAENASGALAATFRHHPPAAAHTTAQYPDLLAEIRKRLDEARAAAEPSVSEYQLETWEELAKALAGAGK